MAWKTRLLAAWLLLASSFGVVAKESVASVPAQSSAVAAAAASKSPSTPSAAKPAPASASAVLPKASAGADADLVETGHYVNKQGKVVHSPAHTRTGQVPAGATAQCGDGSYSFSQSHRGICSHHGGVANWLQ